MSSPSSEAHIEGIHLNRHQYMVTEHLLPNQIPRAAATTNVTTSSLALSLVSIVVLDPFLEEQIRIPDTQLRQAGLDQGDTDGSPKGRFHALNLTGSHADKPSSSITIYVDERIFGDVSRRSLVSRLM